MTRCCLVVTNYERPDALKRVLDAVADELRQQGELHKSGRGLFDGDQRPLSPPSKARKVP